MKNIFLSFIPIFVAVDAFGILPLFVSLTKDIRPKERTKVIIQSMITATVLSIGFVLVGKIIFKWLGIEMGDFMIAGGAILFSLAIIDIVNPAKKRRSPISELGAVPIGTPLIAGPAVLTTSMLIISEYGLQATIISIIVNILLAGAILRSSEIIIHILGEAGSKAVSKIASLLLAAIAVMLIRKGLIDIISMSNF
ncbi:MAG: MarC family protein [Sedimentisphaerales bacterium]|nr:MarC family protein [Sedimentisphaerales bacterium]